MSEHYYSHNPSAAHDEREVIFRVLGAELHMTTDAGTFSRDGLDMGTRVLLEALPKISGSVLDLGCGWGPVGAALGVSMPGLKLTLSDINARAVELAERNLQKNGVKNAKCICSDGFEEIGEKFDAILLNPPIRTGKAAIYALFAEAARHLNAGGALYIVIRKQQGAESAGKQLQMLFDKVERIARDKGYWVYACTVPKA